MSLQTIIQAAEKFEQEHKNANKRIQIWRAEKKQLVKEALTEVAENLSKANNYFANNIYVNEKNMNVSISSGTTRAHYSEKPELGFGIHFSLTENNKIMVSYNEFKIGNGEREWKPIEVLDDLSLLTKEKVQEVFLKGFNLATPTCHLFLYHDFS